MMKLSQFSKQLSLWMQAIAAMMRAQEADPTNLEVLLALGVSHTNGQCMLSSNMCLFCSHIWILVVIHFLELDW